MPAKKAVTRKPAPRKPALPKLAKGETYVGITLHDDRLHHLRGRDIARVIAAEGGLDGDDPAQD